MKNLVKNFNLFINETSNRTQCCGAKVKDGSCSECGEPIENEMDMLGSGDEPDLTLEAKSPSRKDVLKSADKKYPNRSAKEMKKSLGKMKASSFKDKAEKYFGWADDPEAAAASFIRKATKKEPKDS
jgi:hypothetical protein